MQKLTCKLWPYNIIINNRYFIYLAVLSSSALIKANYTKYISLIKTKTKYTKPKLGKKFLHNSQLQSKFLTDLIFCLKISGDWDSLISCTEIFIVASTPLFSNTSRWLLSSFIFI